MALSIGVNQTTNKQNFELKSRGDTTAVLAIEVDFSVTANNLVANQSMKLFTQPSGTRISKIFYAVRTAEGHVCTFDIGVGTAAGDEDNIVDGANGNSTATLAVVHPAFDVVAADAQILLTVRNATNAAKIYVEVELTYPVTL